MKTKLPIKNTCRNCGTQQISRYCHNCGQDLFAGSERSIKEILHNALDTIFAFDNNIIRTLKYLLFYPGKLTNEFFAGRIVCYVYPAKLFWFITLIFFAIIAFDSDNKAIDSDDVDEIIRIVETNLAEKTPENRKVTHDKIDEVIKEKLSNKQIIETLMGYMPYAMFILMPFFALLVQMFFFRKCRYYVSQLIFSFHFHSFVFLFFAMVWGMGMIFPSLADSMLWPISIWVPAVYFVISLYVVYKPKIRNLIWKIPVIVLIYGIAIVIVLLGLVIVSALLVKDSNIYFDIFGD